MKKILFSFVLGIALFVSSFAATNIVSNTLYRTVDDCEMCDASIPHPETGKRCILNGCSPGEVTICSYNCGSLQPQAE